MQMSYLIVIFLFLFLGHPFSSLSNEEKRDCIKAIQEDLFVAAPKPSSLIQESVIFNAAKDAVKNLSDTDISRTSEGQIIELFGQNTSIATSSGNSSKADLRAQKTFLYYCEYFINGICSSFKRKNLKEEEEIEVEEGPSSTKTNAAIDIFSTNSPIVPDTNPTIHNHSTISSGSNHHHPTDISNHAPIFVRPAPITKNPTTPTTGPLHSNPFETPVTTTTNHPSSYVNNKGEISTGDSEVHPSTVKPVAAKKETPRVVVSASQSEQPKFDNNQKVPFQQKQGKEKRKEKEKGKEKKKKKGKGNNSLEVALKYSALYNQSLYLKAQIKIPDHLKTVEYLGQYCKKDCDEQEKKLIKEYMETAKKMKELEKELE